MDYSTLITPIILVSIYFLIGLGGFFLSKRAGHTNIVNDEQNKELDELRTKLDKEFEEKLKELKPKKNFKEKTDPRWDKLKDLL